MGLAVFETMLVVSLWMLVSDFVNRVQLYAREIQLRQVWHCRTLLFDELSSLQWRTQPAGGSLVFRTATTKAILSHFSWPTVDRLEFVRHGRNLVPQELQSG